MQSNEEHVEAEVRESISKRRGITHIPIPVKYPSKNLTKSISHKRYNK